MATIGWRQCELKQIWNTPPKGAKFILKEDMQGEDMRDEDQSASLM